MQTRLEPNRLNLSGSRPVQPVAAASPAVIRKCSACGKSDVVHTMHGQYDERGDPLIEHSVTIELRYVKAPEDVTVRYKNRGWKYMLWQGRHAMQRFICVPCLEGQRLMQREFGQKRARELKSASQGDSYYTSICEDSQ